MPELVTDETREKLREALYEISGITPPLKSWERQLAIRAADVLKSLGEPQKTDAIIIEIQRRGLPKEAMIFALREGFIRLKGNSHNGDWYIKSLPIELIGEEGAEAKEIIQLLLTSFMTLNGKEGIVKRNNIPLLEEVLTVSGGMPADELTAILKSKGLSTKERRALVGNALSRGKIIRESSKRNALIKLSPSVAKKETFSPDQFADILQLKPKGGEEVVITISLTAKGSTFSLKHYKEGRG